MVNNIMSPVEPESPPVYTEVFTIEVSTKIEAIIMHIVAKIIFM